MKRTDIPRGTEAEFQDAVVEVAHAFGWLCVHFRPLRRKSGKYETPCQYDAAGWPDLFLVRPSTGDIVVAELKMPGKDKSAEQEQWLNWLTDCGIASFTWTPDDIDEIETVLRDGAPILFGLMAAGIVKKTVAAVVAWLAGGSKA